MTRAEFLRDRMEAKGLAGRELARLCVDIELDGRPDVGEKRFDDWKGRITDYREGRSEPRDKALRVLSAALGVASDEWPPPRPKPTLTSLDNRLRSLEAEVVLWQELLLEGFALLGLQVDPAADRGERVQPVTASARQGSGRQR